MPKPLFSKSAKGLNLGFWVALILKSEVLLDSSLDNLSDSW